MTLRDEFLSEEDLDLKNLTEEELFAVFDLWLRQAQATNDLDRDLYSHGVFAGLDRGPFDAIDRMLGKGFRPGT